MESLPLCFFVFIRGISPIQRPEKTNISIPRTRNFCKLFKASIPVPVPGTSVSSVTLWHKIPGYGYTFATALGFYARRCLFVSFKQDSQDTQTIDGLMIQVVYLFSPMRVRTAGSDRVRHHICIQSSRST